MVTLGIDCGTSALKAVLVDADEAVLASASRSYRPDHPKPRWSEQDPRVWLAAMLAAIGDLKATAPAAMKALGAIGFSGQMHGAVLLGRDDRPLRPAMLHNDARAFAEARELWEKHPHLADVVGVKPMAGLTAPKLMWLRRHEPQAFARIACVLLPKDYLRLHLTGEAHRHERRGGDVVARRSRAALVAGRARRERRRSGLGSAALRGFRGGRAPGARRRR